jgi:hypothetical protein
MINLESLAKPKIILVPIMGNSFQYHKKKYQIETPDGWWLVSISGNKAEPVESFTWLDENILPDCENKKFEFVKGYTYNNQFVFQNFDAAKRLYGLGLTTPLHFNMVDTFWAIKVVAWEAGHFFYAMPNYTDTKVVEAKMAYDNDENLDNLKGITPEIRTLYLFHSLEREQLRELLRQEMVKEKHEKRMKETPYRLKTILERAGAKLINYTTSGNRIIIDWQLNDGSFSYNSVIDSKTWMVMEAGYCLSGGDKKLNLTSMAQTAKEYEERDVIFITRH